MQFGYEDRIAELRAQVDRISSRQLLDQEQYEQKLDQISRRQATLNRAPPRSARCPTRPAPARSSRPRAAISRPPPRNRPLKPSPISDAGKFVPAPAREARLEAANPATRRLALTPSGDIEGALAGCRPRSIGSRPASAPSSTSLEETYDSKAQRMRGVLADLGIDAEEARATAPQERHRRPVRAGAAAVQRQLRSSGSSIASRSRAPRSTS